MTEPEQTTAPDDLADHPGLARVRLALAAAGVPDRVRVLDAHARTAAEAAAGHPRTVFPTSHDELVRLTDGTSAVVAADRLR